MIEQNHTSLKNRITEIENGLLTDFTEGGFSSLNTYIYGTGMTGKTVAALLDHAGIHYDGFVCSKKYYQSAPDVFCIEDVLTQADKKVNLIIAHNGFDLHREDIEAYSDIINLFYYDVAAGNMYADSEYMTYDWFLQHEQQLEKVYQYLADDLSRDTFSSFINQKISLRFGYLEKVKSHSTQYFEPGLFHFTEKEVFVDCGAYDGDSAVSFIDALAREGIDQYEKIISFEPDSLNFELLQNRKLKNHICIQAGASNQAGQAGFISNSTGGTFYGNEDGDGDIPLDTIDHVLGGERATLIKMDIEGSELAALKGAKETIRQYQPVLAICIYHKKQDLYEIPEYIQSLDQNYQIYIRAYENYASELVLYAVPKSR